MNTIVGLTFLKSGGSPRVCVLLASDAFASRADFFSS
jgi:hypothetical protein